MLRLLDAPQVPSDRVRWFDNRGSTSAELVVYIVLAIVIATILVHVAIDLGHSATTVGTLAGQKSAEILKNISIS